MAIRSNNCDAYFALTTANLRTSAGVADCDAFADISAAAASGVADNDYRFYVISVVQEDGWISLLTAETYLVRPNASGTPERRQVRYEYRLVSSDGGWVIDEVIPR